MSLNNFKKSLIETNSDVFLINSQPMLNYVSKFTGTEGHVLIFKDKLVGFFDTRYALQSKVECSFDEVFLFEDKTIILKEVAKYCDGLHVCFDANSTTLSQDQRYKTLFNHIRYVETSEFRMIKSEQELKIIKEGIALADKILALTIPMIKPGMRENEVVGLLFQNMIAHDIKHFSFNTIVASGVRSAFPHGVASSKVIEANDIITIDFGIMYQGYCSDMTRTFFLGEANPKLVEMYNVVLEANKLAIKACRPHVSGEAIDRVARDYIESKGYGQYFIHGTGHSLGLEIHEAPYVRPGAKTLLQPGMLVTIEPGVYIEGLGGVRIEDVVLITDDSAEVLTKSPKHLK
jgi:Xaa-Pro aminopeptidase